MTIDNHHAASDGQLHLIEVTLPAAAANNQGPLCGPMIAILGRPMVRTADPTGTRSPLAVLRVPAGDQPPVVAQDVAQGRVTSERGESRGRLGVGE